MLHSRSWSEIRTCGTLWPLFPKTYINSPVDAFRIDHPKEYANQSIILSKNLFKTAVSTEGYRPLAKTLKIRTWNTNGAGPDKTWVI